MILLAAATLWACAPSQESSPKPKPASAQSSSERHIYVTSGGLDSDCYQDLGQLVFNEPYAESVIESGDSIAERLRKLAREKYPGKADAVIDVRKQQNEAGTSVEIAGEAVRVQSRETVACAARGMPAALDTAAKTAAGGIIGTVVGGLAGNGGSVYGAEAGGALGAAAGAGMALSERQRREQAEQAFISDRIQQQQDEIAHLRQELAKLAQRECDQEELSEEDCDRRIASIEPRIAEPAHANEVAQPSATSPGNAAGAAGATALTDFQVRNRVQEQQETIDQLRRRIAQIKQTIGDH